MKTKIYKISFYVIKEENYYSCERKGIVLVKKSIIGSCKEIMTGFNCFSNKSDLKWVPSNPFDKRYALANTSSLIDYKVKNYGFDLAIDKFDLNKDMNLATLDDIEKYEQEFESPSFYDYYIRLHIFSKDEKRKINEKVKKIEGSRRIL